MGVTFVVQYPEENNLSKPKLIESLTNRLLKLGAVQSGQHEVNCITYVSTSKLPQRIVHVLNNTEHPTSSFNILDTGTKSLPMVTNGNFDLFMVKMSSAYNVKSHMKTVSNGPRFEVDDFLVKIGIVCVNQNCKGALLEVEYKPCLIPALCLSLMREFVQGVFGINIETAMPIYMQKRLQEVYSPMDTASQYLEHFRCFRKTAISQFV